MKQVQGTMLRMTQVSFSKRLVGGEGTWSVGDKDWWSSRENIFEDRVLIYGVSIGHTWSVLLYPPKNTVHSFKCVSIQAWMMMPRDDLTRPSQIFLDGFYFMVLPPSLFPLIFIAAWSKWGPAGNFSWIPDCIWLLKGQCGPYHLFHMLLSWMNFLQCMSRKSVMRSETIWTNYQQVKPQHGKLPANHIYLSI